LQLAPDSGVGGDIAGHGVWLGSSGLRLRRQDGLLQIGTSSASAAGRHGFGQFANSNGVPGSGGGGLECGHRRNFFNFPDRFPFVDRWRCANLRAQLLPADLILPR
jgi:hypothetical protein